jgi:hypothetical protein
VVRVAGRRVEPDDERVLRAGGLALGDHLVVGGRGGVGQRGVAQDRDVLDRVGKAVGLAVVGDGLDGDLLEVAALSPSSTGATRPSLTKAPIQSCAPIVMSGPLPVEPER